MTRKKTSRTINEAAHATLHSSRAITLPKSGVFNHDLVCNLRGIVVRREALILFLPEGDCCDMLGAIRMATTIHPKCKRVVTISGEAVDTVYLIRGGEWKSILWPKPPRPPQIRRLAGYDCVNDKLTDR